jgi:hypothetical protein
MFYTSSKMSLPNQEQRPTSLWEQLSPAGQDKERAFQAAVRGMHLRIEATEKKRQELAAEERTRIEQRFMRNSHARIGQQALFTEIEIIGAPESAELH